MVVSRGDSSVLLALGDGLARLPQNGNGGRGRHDPRHRRIFGLKNILVGIVTIAFIAASSLLALVQTGGSMGGTAGLNAGRPVPRAMVPWGRKAMAAVEGNCGQPRLWQYRDRNHGPCRIWDLWWWSFGYRGRWWRHGLPGLRHPGLW